MAGDLGLESDSPGQILALPFTLSLSFPICKVEGMLVPVTGASWR